MGDKEFNGDIEEGFKFWWEDYDGDIEEERREIIERVNKIEDPEEREDQYEQLLNALEYDEYFAHNRHFKCESSLIICEDTISRDTKIRISMSLLILY